MAHALAAAWCHWALQRSSSSSSTVFGDCTRSATSGHGSKVPQNDAVKAFPKLPLLHKNPTKWVQVKYLTTMSRQVALTFEGDTQFPWSDSHPHNKFQTRFYKSITSNCRLPSRTASSPLHTPRHFRECWALFHWWHVSPHHGFFSASHSWIHPVGPSWVHYMQPPGLGTAVQTAQSQSGNSVKACQGSCCGKCMVLPNKQHCQGLAQASCTWGATQQLYVQAWYV